MENNADNLNSDEPLEGGNDQPTAESEVVSNDSAQLVAYLDGELSAQEANAVEQRLAEDDGYREHLRQLQQSWDLLDSLPQPTLNENFTQSTVEMVAVAAREEVNEQLGRDSWKQKSGWLIGIGAAVVFGVVGFLGAQGLINRENRQLMRDLPVIERIDLYRDVENIEFLEQLAEQGLFDEEQPDVP